MIPLQTSARSHESSPRALRRGGQVPCVVYGNGVENMMLSCEERMLRSVYEKAGESTLVELDIAGKKVPVLIHELSLHPVSDRFEHVDFYAVDMKKEVETHVHVRLDGESPAVRDGGGVLVTTLDHVTVRCLPTNLPHELTANLGKLTDFGMNLTVADLTVPEGVTVVDDPETMIVTVQEPRAEEVVEAPVAAEGAAPVDGAAPAAGAPAAEKDAKEKSDK